MEKFETRRTQTGRLWYSVVGKWRWCERGLVVAKHREREQGIENIEPSPLLGNESNESGKGFGLPVAGKQRECNKMLQGVHMLRDRNDFGVYIGYSATSSS